MSQVSKKQRVGSSSAWSPSSLDEALDALEASSDFVSKLNIQTSITRAQAERFSTIYGNLRKKYTAIVALEARMRKLREAILPDEVVLPLDLLVHSFCFLRPNDLARSAEVCKYFKAAAERAVHERGVRIGLEGFSLSSLTTQELVEFESNATIAADHIRTLETARSRKKLFELTDCQDVLKMHRGALFAHIQKLVNKGAHIGELHALPSEDEDENENEEEEDFSGAPKNELVCTMYVFKCAMLGDETLFETHDVVATMVKIILEADLRNNELLGSAWASIEGAPSLVRELSKPDVSPPMRAVIRLLGMRYGEAFFEDPLQDVLTFLRKLSKPARVPLRETLERMSKESDKANHRMLARELLVGLEFAGAASSSSSAQQIS